MTCEAAAIQGDPPRPGPRGGQSEQSEDTAARSTASSPVPTMVSFDCRAEQSEALRRETLNSTTVELSV